MDEDLIDEEIDLVEYMHQLEREAAEPVDLETFKAQQEELKKSIAWSNSVLEELSRESSAPQGLTLIGQHVVKNQIQPYLRAARFPHSLILGPPGIGKTHLARWIAAKRDEPFGEFLAPVRAEQLPRSGMVLLDEAHRQFKPEFLFPVMEKGLVTFMAATTRPELMDPAFVSRFALRLDLDLLSQEDSEMLIAKYLNTDEDVSKLAAASAGNPRQAERIADTAKALGTNDPALVLAAVRINADGLDDVHLKILRQLQRVSRPIGVGQLATMLYTSEQDIKEHERLLMNYGLIDLTSGGRVLTKKGQQYADAI
jgi:Holliday junction resolvasome RuvABC ATP-dependent DNA helicase subunit